MREDFQQESFSRKESNLEEEKNDEENLRKIQLNLLNMNFDLIMVNKLFENYNIKDEEQAINYLQPVEGIWMHPFIKKKNSSNQEKIRNLFFSKNKISKNSKCEICNDKFINHLDKNNYELTSENSSILSDYKSQNKKNNESNNSNNSKIKCGICMDELAHPIKIPKCNHTFCYDCFVSYILSKIDSNSIEKIPCPNHNCLNKQLPEEFFLSFLIENELLKYQSLKEENEIKKNPNKIQCPYCKSYALIEKKKKEENLNTSNNTQSTNSKKSIPQQKVYCIENNHEFCSCGRPIHKGKCIEDSVKDYLNKQNVKKCPRCGAYIKKDSGCNHMICPICKYEFCWLCLKASLPNHYSVGKCAGLQYIDENQFSYRYGYIIVIFQNLFLSILSLIIYFGLVITPFPVVIYLIFVELDEVNIFYIQKLKGFKLVIFKITMSIVAFSIYCVYNIIFVFGFAFGIIGKVFFSIVTSKKNHRNNDHDQLLDELNL